MGSSRTTCTDATRQHVTPGSTAARRSTWPSQSPRCTALSGEVRLQRDSRLQVVEEGAREAGDLVELVERLEPARALAVREHAAGLGDREAKLAKLVVACRVQ